MLMDSFYFFFHLSIFDLPCCVSGVQQSDSAYYIYMYLGFPLGSVVQESPCNEGDLGSIPGLGNMLIGT